MTRIDLLTEAAHDALDHAGLTGIPADLGDLGDVTVSGAETDGQVLTSDGAGAFAFESPAAVPSALTDLTDVDTDKSKTPADGDVLTFDGTDWNAETPAGGGGVADLGDLGDVTVTGSETDGQVLTSDGAGGFAFEDAAGGSSLSTGTSFPGTPATGDRYRRSDIDYEVYFYDGTRWLSENVYTASGNGGTATYNADSVLGYIALPADLPIYLVKWDLSWYGSNTGEWDIILQAGGYDWSFSAIDTITASQSTGTNAAKNYSSAIGSVLDGSQADSGTNPQILRIYGDEISGAATIVIGATVHYRKIAA